VNKIKDIIPGKSLAGINLGDNINDYITNNIFNNYYIGKNGLMFLDDEIITIGYEDDGTIYSIMCDERFEGTYKNKLWAGMSVKDVLDNSHNQVAFGGCVIVDGINGIGLPLPKEYDDFERITDFLPINFIFKYLSIFRI